MTELVDLIGKTYGLAGILFFAPLVSTVYLWFHGAKTSSEHTAQIISLHELYSKQLAEVNRLRIEDVNRVTATLLDVQEKRVSDAKEVVETLIRTVTEQTQMNTETNLALERVGDFLALAQNKTPLLTKGHSGERR